jgi:hypothetical protein
MVKSMPSSLAELGKIPGIGDAKLKQYGQQFVGILASLKSSPPSGNDKEPHHETDKPPF